MVYKDLELKQGMRLYGLPDINGFGQSLNKILIFFRDLPSHI